MKKTTLSLLVAIGMSLNLAGCGQTGPSATGAKGADLASGGPGGNHAGDLLQPSASSCADMWKAYVAANPVGHSEKYETKTVSKMGNMELPGNTSTQERTVTESSMDHVTAKVVTEGFSNTETMTQKDFLASCGAGVPVVRESEYKVEVLEKGVRSVTVKAGTFNAYYMKSKMTPKNPNSEMREMVMETWSEGDTGYGIMVKSVSTMSSQGFVSTTTTELVSRH